MSRRLGIVLCLLLMVGVTSAHALAHWSGSAAANRAAGMAMPNATPSRIRYLHAPKASITLRSLAPAMMATPSPPPLSARPPAPPGCSLPNLSLPGHANANSCVVPIPLARPGLCVTLLAGADAASCPQPTVPRCPPRGFIPIDQSAQPCVALPRGAILITRTPGLAGKFAAAQPRSFPAKTPARR